MADKDDIIIWVKTYTNNLFSYTLAKVQQKQIAEDLVQETFLAAYQSHNKYQGKSSIKTWLFSILNHKIADHYRSKYNAGTGLTSGTIEQPFDENQRWKQEYRPKDWGNDKELLDDPEFTKVLKNCFQKLPEKWSSAMQMKYLEEYNADGICSKLEITKSNFWQIIHRAKIQLRNCLEIQWFKE